MKSAPAAASSIVRTTRTVPSAPSGASVIPLHARRAFARTSPSLRSASGSRSQTTTSRPLRAQRAAQPAPMTPPPRRPMVLMSAILVPARSAALLQLQFPARFLGSDDPHIHRFEDRDRALDQLAVRGQRALRQIDVVLKPDAH